MFKTFQAAGLKPFDVRAKWIGEIRTSNRRRSNEGGRISLVLRRCGGRDLSKREVAATLTSFVASVEG